MSGPDLPRRRLPPPALAAALALSALAFAALAFAAPAFAASARAEVLTTGAGRTLSVACAGKPAAIEGNANNITLVGPCSSLRIEGSRNVVSVDLARAGSVTVTGDYNQVIYAPAVPPPLTTLRGYYNQVVPGPIAPTPNTLVLDGALGRRDVACGGLDVVIRESDVRYVLRGGCRSVTVQGRNDIIAAELLPSARLVIGGVGVVVNYVLVGQGPPPAVVVTVHGARATHIARFGDSELTLPTTNALP